MFPDSVDQEFRQELGGHICSKQFGALAIKMWMAGPGGGEKCVTMWLEDGNHLRCLSPDVCWLRLVAGWNFSMDLSWNSPCGLHAFSLLMDKLGLHWHDSWVQEQISQKSPVKAEWHSLIPLQVTACPSSGIRNLPWFNSRKHSLHLSKGKSIIITL